MTTFVISLCCCLNVAALLIPPIEVDATGDIASAKPRPKKSRKSTSKPKPAPSPSPKPSPEAKASPTPVAAVIEFEPAAPAVLPGSKIQVTAKIKDDKGVEIPKVKITFADVDPAFKDYLNVSQDRTNPNVINIVGLTVTSSSNIPRTVPVIAKYIADKVAIADVLNVGVGTAVPAPGPIPTSSPEVDVMWSVLDKKSVADNFGVRIADQYYGITLKIGNNSGYSLELAGVGFTVPYRSGCSSVPTQGAANASERELTQSTDQPKRCQQIIPDSNYKFTRGTIVQQQMAGWRALTLSGLPQITTLLGGFKPFFHNANHASNFSNLVIAFGDLATGVTAVWPDTVSTHLNNLDDQALRTDNQNVRTIIENNHQYSGVTFFPRHFLDDYFQRKPGDWKKMRNQPDLVNEALGEMVLIGEQVQFVNRIRFNTAANTITNSNSNSSANSNNRATNNGNSNTNSVGNNNSNSNRNTNSSSPTPTPTPEQTSRFSAPDDHSTTGIFTGWSRLLIGLASWDLMNI